MSTTTIISNGSKWLGEPLDTIDQLCDVLAETPLDPTFEEYGNFILPMDDASDTSGMVRFWGNFFLVSHVFSIDTDDPAVIHVLTAAIRANQQTEAYRKARIDRQEQDAERERYFRVPAKTRRRTA